MGTFTMETGFGMLGIGVSLILIAGLIMLKVINTMEKNKLEEEKQKQWEKKYGHR